MRVDAVDRFGLVTLTAYVWLGFAGAAVALEVSVKQRETDYAHYALAVVLGHLGKVDQAAQHLRRAIQMQPRNRTAALADPDFSELAKYPPIRDLLTGS